MADRKRVIIIGAGFAGLDAVEALKSAPVDVLVIDRHNYHTFTPLLYEVATCGLDPSAIAYPIRSIFRENKNTHFLLGSVTAINHDSKSVTVNTGYEIRVEPYDYLLIAAGSVTNFYAPAIEDNAFGLKDLEDAIVVRQHILKLFEKASWMTDSVEREALTTFVVVGGGPTGIETSGALYELYNHVLSREYGGDRSIMKARVLLLEATDRLLAPYPARLRDNAVSQLQSLGVEVLLNAAVDHVEPHRVVLKDGRTIATHTLIWAAGVKSSPLAAMLEVPLQRMGRVPVENTMQVIGREGIYAAGDLAYLLNEKGEAYPMVIPVAKQQGKLAAQNMLQAMNGGTLQPFHYSDLGIMATVGRKRAVAWIFNRIQLTGLIAWFAWLFLHLITLMGFRNRISVFISWVWNYVTYDRSVRIILSEVRESEPVTSETQNAAQTTRAA